MPLDTLIALVVVLAAAAWTPGPNNAMLAASGATFGFRATLPHMQGVIWGFPAMVFAVALGLGGLFRTYPELHGILRMGGALVLLWVAWKIATAAGPGGGGGWARPFTFWQAAGFQWINPKAWVMCLSLVPQFVTGARPVYEALIVALASAAVGATSAAGWAGLGAMLARFLADPLRLRLFNGAMAALIVLGVVVMLAG